jgi:hypothetical protein
MHIYVEIERTIREAYMVIASDPGQVRERIMQEGVKFPKHQAGVAKSVKSERISILKCRKVKEINEGKLADQVVE